MLKEKLCQIGFTENESLIYLELLRLGPQAVSVVARRASLNRSTAYSVLRGLVKKGVVSSYHNGNVKFFSADDPNSLVGYVDGMCRSFEYQKSQLLTEIPNFRSLMSSCDFKKPVVSYFDGLEGVKQVAYTALTTRSTCRCYLPLHKWFESGLMDFVLKYQNFRVDQVHVPLRAIVPDRAEVRDFFQEYYGRDDEMTNVLYVNENEFSHVFENEMNIYGNKVAILNLEKGSEYAVLIEDREISEMHKLMFDMAWKGFAG